MQCFFCNYFVMIFCLRSINVLIFIGHGCYTPWILVFSRVCRRLIQFCKIRLLMYKICLLSALKKYYKRLSFLGVFYRSVLLCPLFFVNDIHWGIECKVLYYCEPALTTNCSFCKTEMCSSFQCSIMYVFFFFNLFKASLTYAEAQMRIDSASMNDDITVSLRGLNKLAKILKKKRIDNG